MTKQDIRKQETNAWKAFEKYQRYLQNSEYLDYIEENRKFYRGEQYSESLDPTMPKPLMNIVFEYIEKVKAKLLDTPYAVQFNSNHSEKSQNRLDEYYKFVMDQINDREVLIHVVHAGLLDGIGCAFTVYDEDTYGNRGLFKGCQIRKFIPIENVFFANPYCENPQNQAYLGYVMKMSVEEARRICTNEAEKELIVPDNWDISKDYNVDDVAFDTCTVVTRFFRDKQGEVCFECATKYCDLYKTPHYLNPFKNDDKQWNNDKTTDDYKNMAPEKSDVQTPLQKETDKAYIEKLGKFNRYPFAYFRPYPIPNCVLGESPVKQIIPNQKQSNFINMMSMLNFQSHAMGKWIVADDALANGETITNDPSQVIRVKSKFNQAVSSLIQRIEPSTVSAEQINQGTMVANETRQVFGFNNLTSENNMNDVSGFALQQAQKQQNLVLQIPQEHLWEYIKETARNDLLFFKFYIDKAQYYTKASDGEYENNENFRRMSQDIVNARATQDPQFASRMLASNKGSLELPKAERVKIYDVTRDDFIGSFEVSITVTQGIASSQISESQHYSQVMQYVFSGNVDAPMIRAWIQCDPAFSPTVKANLNNMLEVLESNQIAQAKAENEQLRATITQLINQLKSINQTVEYQNARVKSLEQATIENARMNRNIVNANMANETTDISEMTEGEVKSNNSRGIEGTSFDTYAL